MKIPWTAVLFTAVNGLSMTSLTNNAMASVNNSKNKIPSEALIKERVENLKLPFNVTYDREITNQVRSYLVYGKASTEHILARSTMFFPIFEHHLSVNHLPLELKFLPMVESKLKPTIKSPVGAAGLWQFVPRTAKLYGITVNAHVDERLDPYKSTEGAAALLQKLYSEYCDWAVVLAAYNCGTVRVNKAIKIARSTNYEDIKSYLPQETQKYIPRFVAAAYVANYYEEHGLAPAEWPLNRFDIRTVKIKEAITLKKVSELTKLDLGFIRKINPGYLSGSIPATRKGSYLALPSNAMSKVLSYLEEVNSSASNFRKGAFRKKYVVNKGETIDYIAYKYGCSPEEIKAWNNFNSSRISVNQQLYLYFRPEVKWKIA